MMSAALRCLVATAAMAFVGCSSNNRGGAPGTGGRTDAFQADGGEFIDAGSGGGSGGTAATSGHAGTVGSSGTLDGGDDANSGGSTSNGDNTASSASPTGGATGSGGGRIGGGSGNGGNAASGGSTGTAGGVTGGSTGSGGNAARGGRTGAGGRATGGSTGSGGNTASGGGTGTGASTAGGTAGGGGGTATGGRSSADGSAGQGGSGGTTISVAYPLKLAPGKRYLVTQDGQPYLFAGDAAWSLAAGLTTPQQIQYLDDRMSRGFNTSLVNLIERYYVSHSYGAPNNAYGEAPFTAKVGGSTWDMSTPNEAYWARVDQLIDAADARGIQILAVPAYLGLASFEGWNGDMTANSTAQLQSYGTFLGNRYKSRSNLIWVMGGDLCPSDLAPTNTIARAIKAADSAHIMTAHGMPGITTDCFSSTGWLDFGAVYVVPPSAPGPVWQTAQNAYARTPVLPFFHIEGAYEGESGTSLSVRQEVYESLLNGGFGHIYGDSPVWKAGLGWQEALAAPGAQDNARAFGLFGARRWDLLVPDVGHTFMTAGAGSNSGYASAAMSSDGTLAIAYTPATRALTFDMSKLSGATTVRWYDPTNGTFTGVAGSPFANSGSQTFTPPGKNSRGEPDQALVFEAQ
jgi:hypothetical protein